VHDYLNIFYLLERVTAVAGIVVGMGAITAKPKI